MSIPPAYQAAENRYDDAMPYRRTGDSGLRLPAISLGLWQNFGTEVPLEQCRAILRRAFDRGVTHFDLANNYGPPYGRAEENFGRYLAEGGLGGTGRRPVVVGQVEVGDAEVECAAKDGPLPIQRRVVAEVMPQPE